MKRRKARELIIQALYQIDMVKCTWQEALQHLLEHSEDETDSPSGENDAVNAEPKSNEFIEEVLGGIFTHQQEIDAAIRDSLKNWSFERLALVDRAILRLGVFELKYRVDIPQQVAINEAVELAKAYGSEQSRKFINGVLSHVVKQGV